MYLAASTVSIQYTVCLKAAKAKTRRFVTKRKVRKLKEPAVDELLEKMDLKSSSVGGYVDGVQETLMPPYHHLASRL